MDASDLGIKDIQLRDIIDRFSFGDREITTISLTSPSNAANMAIGSNHLYKLRKKENPAYSTFDFRVEQYKKVFLP